MGKSRGFVRIQGSGLTVSRLTWQVLQADVVDNLIVSALQERGVDGAEGPEPLARQPCGERHCVLLCDAHVKCAVVETRIEAVESCAASHRGVDPDDAGVALCLRNQCIREDVGVRWPLRQIPISVCCSSFHNGLRDIIECYGPYAD